MSQLVLEYFLGRGWQQAADDCIECSAPREIKLVRMDEKNPLLGIVEVRGHHARGCVAVDPEIPNRHSEHIMTSFTAYAGWTWCEQLLEVQDKQFHTFSMVSDITVCSGCMQFITRSPLIVFGPDQLKPEWEAHFCQRCVDLNDLDKILLGGKLRR